MNKQNCCGLDLVSIYRRYILHVKGCEQSKYKIAFAVLEPLTVFHTYYMVCYFINNTCAIAEDLTEIKDKNQYIPILKYITFSRSLCHFNSSTFLLL